MPCAVDDVVQPVPFFLQGGIKTATQSVVKYIVQNKNKGEFFNTESISLRHHYNLNKIIIKI